MSKDIRKKWESHQGSLEPAVTKGIDLFDEKDKNIGGDCSKCSGSGYVIKKGKPEKCTCGGVKKKEEVVELGEEDVDKRLRELDIPEFFIGREFDLKLLKQNENIEIGLRQSGTMDYYIHSLEEIYGHFVIDKKLPKSYMVIAPQGHAKNHLVYLSMIEAVKKGKTVAPYYDTGDIYRMVYDEDHKALHEILNADVCFVALEPTFLSNRDTQAVKYVLRKRGKRNLPLVVTSRFNMDYLKKIEPHLQLNMGVKNVEKGDYMRLQEVIAPYPRDYVEKYKKYNK